MSAARWMMLFALALAGCSKDKPPILAEMLADEDAGAMDDATLSDSEQIEEVQARYEYYLDAATTKTDKDAAKASCRRSIQRIIERARQRVKKAEDALQRAKERAAPKESA